MATSFIGKPISLLSHSDVRYRGILAGIDHVNSTIQLQNVYSMGTENRRPPGEFIPPAEQPYQFIIFRASEVKDLAYDSYEPPARVRSVHDDPAVIGVQGPPTPESAPSYADNTQVQPIPDSQQGLQQQAVPSTLGTRPPLSQQPQSTSATASKAGAVNGAPAAEGQKPQSQQGGRGHHGRRGNANRDASSNSSSIHTAAASLEKVERALGDLRLSNAQAQAQAQSGASSSPANGTRNGTRRGGQRQAHVEIKVPTTDFDFAGSNARFDKSALGSGRAKNGSPALSDDEKTNPSDDEGAQQQQQQADAAKAKAKEEEDAAYNPQKSFFDNLSSSATALPPGRGARGGGRRGGAKSRREEEREKNVATFGEPGGVGLMGPGAYVGGYGGYGRRGGGRGARRGGGGRRAPANTGDSTT